MSDCRETLPLKKEDALALSKKLTKGRFARRNQLKAKARKRYPVCYPIPVHRKLTLDHLLEPLAKFLGHELDEKPYPPPSNLGALIEQLEPIELGVITLTPLLNGIMHDWDADDPSEAERKLCERIGQHLHDQLGFKKLLAGDKAARKLAKKIQRGRIRRGPQYNFLKSEWTNVDCVKAGHWLLQCALSLAFSPQRFFFPLDEAGFPTLASEWETGKFKVFKHLNDWWEEFRLYHRKDGKVVKEGDDLMAATRYGIMMLRFASTKAAYDKFRRPIEYPKVKYV